MVESKPPVEPYVENEDYWAPIPEALLYDPTISDGAVRVYGVLRRHGDDPRNCHPGHKRIAEFIGKSQRTIPALIRQLEDAGWILRIPRKDEAGDWTSNAYRVFGRAQVRGVRAQERIPPTHKNAHGSTRENAPKESKSEREQSLSADLKKRVNAALKELVERDVKRVKDIRDRRAVRARCRLERREDGTLGLLNDTAGVHPEWSTEQLADYVEGFDVLPEDAEPVVLPDCAECGNERIVLDDEGCGVRCRCLREAS